MELPVLKAPGFDGFLKIAADRAFSAKNSLF
jgi:hypothetical protein